MAGRLDEEQLSILLQRVYEAPLNPESWPIVMRAVAEAAGGRVGAIQATDLDTGVITALIANDVPAEAVADYNRDFAWHNPRILAFDAVGPGILLEDRDIFDERAMARHTFYQDFLAKYGWFRWNGMTLAPVGGMQVSLSVHRGIGQAPATADERRVIIQLAPHLERAVRLTLRLGDLQAERDALVERIQNLGTAIVELDRKGCVLRANRAAEAVVLAADGLAIREGRLEIADSSAARQFERMLRLSMKVADRGVYADAGPATMQVARPSGRRAYELSLAPLSRGALGVGGPAVLVFISDPEARAKSIGEVVRGMFGLTPAEARVAVSLADGKSIADIADMFGRSKHTIRDQTRAILGKTGVSRQAELVALLLRLASNAAPRA